MGEKTISLSDGDVEAIKDGKEVGPWLLQDLAVFVKIDDGEASQT
jgi:hypothetical protein